MIKHGSKKSGWLTAKDYNFIYSRAPRFCIDLILKDKQGGILMSLRKIEPHKGTWHFPGGRVFFKESIEKATQRIALSELGSKVIVHKMLGFMEFFREIQGKSKRHTVSLVFSAELVNKKVRNSFQSEEFRYFSKAPPNTYPIHIDLFDRFRKKALCDARV